MILKGNHFLLLLRREAPILRHPNISLCELPPDWWFGIDGLGFEPPPLLLEAKWEDTPNLQTTNPKRRVCVSNIKPKRPPWWLASSETGETLSSQPPQNPVEFSGCPMELRERRFLSADPASHPTHLTPGNPRKSSKNDLRSAVQQFPAFSGGCFF